MDADAPDAIKAADATGAAGASAPPEAGWLRWREPAAIALLAALLVAVLSDVAVWILEAGQVGLAAAGQYGLSQSPVTAVLSAALAGVLLSCHLLRPTRHVAGLTVAAILGTAAAAVLGLVLSLLRLSTPGALWFLLLLGELSLVTVPAVAAALLLALHRHPAHHPGAAAPTLAEPLPDPAPAPALDQARQPTWAVDAAAGAAWRTAGDAAAGAPAASWGAPGETGSWGEPPG